jgi:hypothetical protein
LPGDLEDALAGGILDTAASVQGAVNGADGDVRHFGDQVDAAALFGHCRSGVLRVLEYTVKGKWRRDCGGVDVYVNGAVVRRFECVSNVWAVKIVKINDTRRRAELVRGIDYRIDSGIDNNGHESRQLGCSAPGELKLRAEAPGLCLSA